jgi:hypothetical protein
MFISGKNVFIDMTDAIPEDTTSDISMFESISPSLSVTFSIFLCFYLRFCLSCPQSIREILCKQQKVHTNLQQNHNFSTFFHSQLQRRSLWLGALKGGGALAIHIDVIINNKAYISTHFG